MATQFEIACALMAGRAYQTNRDPLNQFPIPVDWIEFSHVPNNPGLPQFTGADGFEAVSFQNKSDPNQIVISFAGTDGFFSIDQFANLGLATGVGSAQLLQAVDYYLKIKADNRNANVTFTGHSLGGGLAALMGVFFGLQAVTFDQAPFAKSTQSIPPDLELGLPARDVATDIKRYLLSAVLTDPRQIAARDIMVARLSNFLDLRLAVGGIPNSNLVTNFRVAGEFLGALPGQIGPPATPLTHGDYFGPFDLHSQALLTTFLQSDAFREMTNRLPELLGMVFDSKLFAYKTVITNTQNPNLLELLIRHQAGVRDQETNVITIAADHMLDRFTTDLDKLVKARGTQAPLELVKTLVAFAMEKYYSETKDSAGYQKELFLAVTGGLQFDTKDIASDIRTAKGYKQFFTHYLDNEATFSRDERDLIRQNMTALRDWSIALGADGMTVTDSKNRAPSCSVARGPSIFAAAAAMTCSSAEPATIRWRGAPATIRCGEVTVRTFFTATQVTTC